MYDKKTKKPRFALYLLCLSALLTTCDKDETVYPTLVSYATIVVPATSRLNYHFILDDGAKAYADNKSRLDYDSSGKNGKRVVIYYNLLPQAPAGYDCSLSLFDVGDILSKEVEVAKSQQDLVCMGYDPIGIEKARISGGWLDIQYYYPAEYIGKEQHRLSLVDNQTVRPPADMPPGYTYLEFRQNAGGDPSGQKLYKNFISYRLGSYDPAVTGSKGIYLRVAAPYGQTTYLLLEYAEKKN